MTSTEYWEITSLRSRHERHVRDLDNFPLFNVLFVLLTNNLAVSAGNPKRVERMDLLLVCACKRGDLLILIFLKVAIGQISVVFCGFFVADFFLAEVFRSRLCKVPEEHFENDTVRFCVSGTECDGRLTIVEVRDSFQDEAVGVEGLRSTDSAEGVPVRVQYDLGVDEIP